MPATSNLRRRGTRPAGVGVPWGAMIETLYSTGMRRSELAGLSLFDIDRERGTVMINQTLVSKRDKGPSGLPPTRADLYA